MQATQSTRGRRRLVEVAWLAPAFLTGLILMADGAVKLPYFAWNWPTFITALAELVGGAAIMLRWTRAWGALGLFTTMLFASLAEAPVLGVVSLRPNLFFAAVTVALAWHWSGNRGPRTLLIVIGGFVTGLAALYALATLVLLGSSLQTLGGFGWVQSWR